MNNLIKFVNFIPKYFFIILIVVYQNGISPFLGAKCRFYPSCSQYALACLRKHNLLKAIWYSFRRLIKCHPFNAGGYDPVP